MEKDEEGKWQGAYIGPLTLGVGSGTRRGGSGLQGSLERRGGDEEDKNRSEGGRERREKKEERTRKGGE